MPGAGDGPEVERVVPDRVGGVTQAVGGENHAEVGLCVLPQWDGQRREKKERKRETVEAVARDLDRILWEAQGVGVGRPQRVRMQRKPEFLYGQPGPS